MIDFFGQKDFYLKYKKQCNEIFERVLSSETLLRGNSVEQFEEKVRKYIGRKYAVAVNSGTDALIISLKSLGVKEGDEIMVPAFSFVASATPIKLLGATPVFIDVDINTGLIDISKIESKITTKTKGLIAVDLFGECPNYDELINICKKNNIFLLEDGAQSLGSTYKGIFAGNFGEVSTISFDVSKVLFGISTGGVILTDDNKIYERACKLRGHGFNPETRNFELLGFNSNMSSLNAALLVFRLDLIDEFYNERDFVRKTYDAAFNNNSKIELLHRNDTSIGNNHKYVLLVDNRDKLMKYLKELNIPTKIHYNEPIPYYDIFGESEEFPNAKYFSEHVISLPIHPFLQNSDLNYITESINKFYE